MTRVRDRFFAGFGALLFLVTGSALAIAVIVNGVSNNNDKKDATTSQTKQLAACVIGATTPQPNKAAEGKLAGKTLSDFSPCSAPSLLKQDLSVGTGAAVTASDTVTVDYTGAVAATGTIFQSSLDTGQPASFKLDSVIKGWTDGVPGMQTGGVRRLYIPAAAAYGANPPEGSGIPANADLVFDITLQKIGS